jgi:uncharacterized protein (TIGR03000 family)
MFWSVVVVCVCLPGVGLAQHGVPDPDTGPFGIVHNYGFPYGPRVAPSWSYYGIEKGPNVIYPTPPKYSGVFGYGMIPVNCRMGQNAFPNGVSLIGLPVPVYGPIPETFGNDPLVKQWRSTLAPGLVGYGWVGLYSAMPRPKYLTVYAWPGLEPSSMSGPNRPPVPQSQKPQSQQQSQPPAAKANNLTLSVKVPQSTAEVRVDGRPTTQTGTDRTYESPPLEAGKSYGYTITARWMENGQMYEVTKTVTGGPGEVVRVDFGIPAVAIGK